MKVFSLIKNGRRQDFSQEQLNEVVAKGGPGSGRRPEGGANKSPSDMNDGELKDEYNSLVGKEGMTSGERDRQNTLVDEMDRRTTDSLGG